MTRHDRIQLSDDGSLDTVLVCRGCGAEARYHYDASATEKRAEELTTQFQQLMPPGTTRNVIERRVNEQLYAEFVEWAKGEFADDHDCQDNWDRE